MFTNITKHKYTITLPAGTTKEVKEWFELMESKEVKDKKKMLSV